MKGISFSTPLIPKVADGSKTVTRRILQWPIKSGSDGGKRRVFGPGDVDEINRLLAAPGKWPLQRIAAPHRVGEVCYVREALERYQSTSRARPLALYRADERLVVLESERPRVVNLEWRWKVRVLPGRFMPREAARYFVKVESLRVERVQEITPHDALAEGVDYPYRDDCPPDERAVQTFAALWDTINGKRAPWASNPAVLVIGFRRVDSGEAAA